jgi:hypothetical protein
MTVMKLVLLIVLLLLSACAGLPVRGSIGRQTIETRVKLWGFAKYYYQVAETQARLVRS